MALPVVAMLQVARESDISAYLDECPDIDRILQELPWAALGVVLWDPGHSRHDGPPWPGSTATPSRTASSTAPQPSTSAGPSSTAESHATGLDRNEFGGLLVAAASLVPLSDALVSLLAINGLRVSEASGADIDALGQSRGGWKGMDGVRRSEPLAQA